MKRREALKLGIGAAECSVSAPAIADLLCIDPLAIRAAECNQRFLPRLPDREHRTRGGK